ELAGVVSEIEQKLGDRWCTGPQVRGTARQLRRYHAGPHWIHTGEEGIAPGGAALHGDIVHEDRAFLAVLVDVRRFPDHQSAMVDARLHPADVVAHDEDDIGLLLLLLLLRGQRRARHRTDGDECKQRGPKLSHDFHGKPPDLRVCGKAANETTPLGEALLQKLAVFTGESRK